MSQNALVHVYTGDGKGKSTACWGLALRAAGRGLRVGVVQFMKPDASGEVIAAKKLGPNLQVFGETRKYSVCDDQRESAECREDSRLNFETAKNLMLSGDYDLLILDEMNVVLHYEYVSQPEMLDLLRSRSSTLELILTGRYAPDWLIDEADIVTEMVEIKHPASRGIKARKGVEF
jgi:cob(I)alamin adenosyltransferase